MRKCKLGVGHVNIIIIASHAPLLFSLSLGKLERGGNVERKEVSKMVSHVEPLGP